VDIEYLTQFIEIDAIAFAHSKMNEFFQVKTMIPGLFKEKVHSIMKNFKY